MPRSPRKEPAGAAGTGRRWRLAQPYWAIFEHLREELGYADYLGALQRYRTDITAVTGGIMNPNTPQLHALGRRLWIDNINLPG